jgi:hypothetical protein
MNRRDFVVNASTAFAAALAALATPFRLLAGQKAAPAGVPAVLPREDPEAQISRILYDCPCRCMGKFVLLWNGPYPRVEEIQTRLDAARQWRSPSGDTKWEQERVRRCEKELADAVQSRAEDPAGYAAGLGRRIDVEVTRRSREGQAAEWRLLEWLVTEWAPEWIEYVGVHGSVYLFDDWATWVESLRDADVTSHADLIDVAADLAAIRNWLDRDRGNRPTKEIGEKAYEAMDRTGWLAAFDAAFDACFVVDNMTEEILLLLWNNVEECVAQSGVSDFEPVMTSLRVKAIKMLGELNAETEVEDDLADAA